MAPINQILTLLADENRADLEGRFAEADAIHESARRLASGKVEFWTPNQDRQPRRKEFEKAEPDFYTDAPDADIWTPKWPKIYQRHPNTGLLMIEPDERVWLQAPRNENGYMLSKGRLEPGYTDQQNALKEAYEELGLQGHVDEYLGDYAANQSMTRFFLGQRDRGKPWKFSTDETRKVALAPIDKAEKMLSKQRDLHVLKDLRRWLKKQGSSDTPTRVASAEEEKELKGVIPSWSEDFNSFHRYEDNWQGDNDRMYDLYDRMDNVSGKVVKEFIRQPTKPQNWPLVPAARLKKIWSDFARYGFVRDERGLDEIAQIMIDNVFRLKANTELAGHTQLSAEEVADLAGYEWNEELDEQFGNHILDEHGQWRLSDYALEPLIEDAIRLDHATIAEEKLVYMDRMLNRIHQRGDIAALFVEGGWRTLTEISV